MDGEHLTSSDVINKLGLLPEDTEVMCIAACGKPYFVYADPSYVPNESAIMGAQYINILHD
jgi:hypothetical protein